MLYMKCERSHIGMSRRQQLFAWIILSVYVPVVLISSFHVHSFNENSVVLACHDCQSAMHHSGHITSSQAHHDYCLSCRFLNTQVDSPAGEFCVLVDQYVSEVEFCQAAGPIIAAVAHPPLRAPPFILCYISDYAG